jgi:hypothetical protein
MSAVGIDSWLKNCLSVTLQVIAEKNSKEKV